MGSLSVMAVLHLSLQAGMAVRHAARHYTLEGRLDKVKRSRSLQAELASKRGTQCIRKMNLGNENFKL
jgi:hypothetical protein